MRFPRHHIGLTAALPLYPRALRYPRAIVCTGCTTSASEILTTCFFDAGASANLHDSNTGLLSRLDFVEESHFMANEGMQRFGRSFAQVQVQAHRLGRVATTAARVHTTGIYQCRQNASAGSRLFFFPLTYFCSCSFTSLISRNPSFWSWFFFVTVVSNRHFSQMISRKLACGGWGSLPFIHPPPVWDDARMLLRKFAFAFAFAWGAGVVM